MEKFIPYEKLSKKERRKIDQARRQTWGTMNPVTRKPVNSRAYNRNKARDWKRDHHEPISVFIGYDFWIESSFAPIITRAPPDEEDCRTGAETVETLVKSAVLTVSKIFCPSLDTSRR